MSILLCCSLDGSAAMVDEYDVVGIVGVVVRFSLKPNFRKYSEYSGNSRNLLLVSRVNKLADGIRRNGKIKNLNIFTIFLNE